jgi:hypothetical protein
MTNRLMLIAAASMLMSICVPTAAAPLRVQVESSLQSTRLVVPEAGRAFVEEVHRVVVPPGGGTFSLTWQDEKIDRASALLLPVGNVAVLGPRYPGGAEKVVEWGLTLPAGGPAEVRLAYAVDGISLTPEMSLTLSPAGDIAELACSYRLTNDSGCRFENAAVVCHGVRQEVARLEPGQAVTLTSIRAPRVPVARTIVVDVARFGAAAAVLLSFANLPAAGLGVMPLPGSRIRIVQAEADGGLRPVAESTLARTPIGETAEFLAGFEQGIAVKREMTLCQQVNARKDASQRVVAFDMEEEYCLDLESRLADDTNIEVMEHVEGHWEPLESSVPGARLDAGAMRFSVTVPAFGKAQVRYRVLRRNLAP